MASRHVPGVRKSRSGRWEARYRDAQGHQRTHTCDTRADAIAFLDAIRTDVRRGDWIDPAGARTPFGEWADDWWATTVNLRPSTRARDDSYYRNQIEPTFGELQLGSIDHVTVREWIAGLSASGLAPATVHKAYQVLSKIMRAAVDGGLIRSSPCERQPLPRIEREEMAFLVPAQVATLADAMDRRYRPLVLLGAYAGLRAGELFALRRSRIDLLRRRVDVAETVVEVRGHLHIGPPKTRAGRRAVPMPRFVAEELTRHVTGLDQGDLVFPAPEGGLVRASLFRRRFWQDACIKAGLGELRQVGEDADGPKRYEGLRLHDLRHTAVALWVAAGASATEIAARAGHSSVVTVLDRYGHLLPASETKVTAALDRMGRAASQSPGVVVPMNRSGARK